MGRMLTVVMVLTGLMASGVFGSDWMQFRGSGGRGVSDEEGLPVRWSEGENLKWKRPLPGPGSSSPIVVGDRVFVTCYSGYGVDSDNPGEMSGLRRHLICLNVKSGDLLWEKVVPAEVAEDSYRGYIREHGYASSTPVTDGEGVYVFFGKTGVLGFDMEGEQLWQTSVGTSSSNRRWGSAASPILHENLVIVNASEEGRKLVALEKATGKEVWKVEADKSELSYSTPTMVEPANGRKEVVLAVPWEVWAFDPESGATIWYAGTELGGNISPSPIVADGVAYVFGGFPRTRGTAIRVGGKDDVTDTHVLWTTDSASYVPSPVFLDGRLYWVSDRGIAYCMEAKTAKVVYEERLPAKGGGKPVYASAVLADGRLYVVSRRSGTFVLAAKPEFEQLALNQFGSDDSDFNGSPAISDGRILLRSNRFVYCIEGTNN